MTSHLNYLQRDKFSWTQASLPIRHCGLGIIPASSIAEAAYAGSVIDTSDLPSKLTTGIKEKHPYRLEEMILEDIERTQDIHRLSDSYSLTGLLVRKSKRTETKRSDICPREYTPHNRIGFSPL